MSCVAIYDSCAALHRQCLAVGFSRPILPSAKMKLFTISLCLALACGSFSALATKATAPAVTEPVPTVEAPRPSAKSGLPVPRFVTTRSASINVRTGPGERYPVKWVLKKKGMPVEVIAEYDTWRKVRDWEGTEGWVHQAMLTGRRAAVVYPKTAILREKAEPSANPVAELTTGVIAKIEKCHGEWCELSLEKLKGFVRRSDLWGVYPTESVE